ncbi:MAG: ABC transporter ATP-binding protein [Rhodobacteraceae bacterium]|nr:ABC transporter ATP-binding protein [Paracoccaceae bacterium]
MTQDLLALEGLTKAYPGVVANDAVSLTIRAGEVHALLGENGAGKSTLVKMIYGLVKPDSGAMTLDGAPFEPADPRVARAAGIGMVFQHFSLFEALTVAENIALGMENPPKTRELSRQIREVSETYGLPLNPDRTVGTLSAGERQRVEIIRCLLQNPRLLVMDEPTSVLTPQEVDILFTTLRKLSAEGTAILYISHKLEEIRALCERATILRGGKVVETCDPREESARSLAEMMVGKSFATATRQNAKVGAPMLVVDGLHTQAASSFGTSLKDISLRVAEGEILGIGGVAGNGQDELLAALSGEARTMPGAVTLRGEHIGSLPPRARRAAGLCVGPEERLGHAAAPSLSLTENALLTADTREGLSTRGFISWRKVRAFTEKVIANFDVRTPGPEVAAQALSGGNLQKFVMGREMLQRPAALVINQPTWGVDAAAAASIRQKLIELAGEGVAILVISQDLDELFEIADRFAALNEGRLSPARPMAELDMEEIGLMLGGVHGEEAA